MRRSTLVLARRRNLTNEKMKRVDFVLSQFKQVAITQLLITRRKNGTRRRLIDVLRSNVFLMTKMNRAMIDANKRQNSVDLLRSLTERLTSAM